VNLGVSVASEESGGVVDFAYLEGFVAGDKSVILEVLTLFRQQAEAWAKGLDAADPGWRDVVHTIKGAARGVGANALGDVCTKTEAEGESGLPAVRAALDAAVTDIAAYQARA
jgi:HPt (histidine-containing phosphotransfer) domain-containing protein